MLLHLPIAILAGFSITPAVDVMPEFDITRECRDEGGAQATVENRQGMPDHATNVRGAA